MRRTRLCISLVLLTFTCAILIKLPCVSDFNGEAIADLLPKAVHSAVPVNSTFAYSFVIGGCNPMKPDTYQNYLFNIAVATKNLRELGASADIVTLLQLSQDAGESKLENIAEVNLLKRMGVRVFAIPPQASGKESFYRTQLDKFRILSLTEYDRILFMDGDIMPLSNLDYLFEMSSNGTLQENVVVQGIYEPANGGFFMLRPTGVADIQKVIERREESANILEHPHFDPIVGWGHEIASDDMWIGKKQQGTNWTFLAAFADQGLLYYYTKYHRKSVSICKRNGTVENWQSSSNGTVTLNVSLQRPFGSVDDNIIDNLHGRNQGLPRPFNSFVHFTGNKKPWLQGGPPESCCHNSTHCCRDYSTRLSNGKHYWYWQLSQVAEKFGLDIDFSKHWEARKSLRPPLGLYPTYRQVPVAKSDITTPLVPL